MSKSIRNLPCTDHRLMQWLPLSQNFLAGIGHVDPFSISPSTMVHFRRNPGRFFFYWLACGFCTLCMSHMFRSMGAVSTSLGRCHDASHRDFVGYGLLSLVLLSLFPNMLGWCRWIQYINPVSYVFRSLMVNEFAGVEYECSRYIPSGPGYPQVATENNICNVVGAMKVVRLFWFSFLGQVI